MKKLLLFFLVFYSVTAMSQDSSRYRRINPMQISLTKGIFAHQNYHHTLGEIRKLAPGSQLLKNDLQNFSNPYYNSLEPLVAYSLSLGFRLRTRDGKSLASNPVIRAGFTYISQLGTYQQYVDKTESPYDTLVSQQTGQEYYVDSITEKRYYAEYFSDILLLEMSAIWRTKAQKRWAFFGGVGIGAGLSLNANTEIAYTRRAWLQTSSKEDFSYPNYTNNNQEFELESFRNKTSSFYTVFFPLGIEWRLGKKNEFLRNVYLFYELRPGLSLLNIPETSVYAKTFLHHSIGLRIQFN
jgi:hypothetical protein